MEHNTAKILTIIILLVILVAVPANAQEPPLYIGKTVSVNVSGTSLLLDRTLKLTGTGYSSTLAVQATGTLYGSIVFSALSGKGNSTITIESYSLKLRIEGTATMGYRQESFSSSVTNIEPLGASGPHTVVIDLGRSGKYEHIYLYINLEARSTLSLYVAAKKAGAIGTIQALSPTIPVYWTGDPGDISINPYIITSLNLTLTVMGETIDGEREVLAQDRIPPPLNILAQGHPTVILESPSGNGLMETLENYTTYIIASLVGLIVIAASVYYILNRY